MATATEVERGATLAWIAETDTPGHEMERPFMRLYVNGRDEAEALAEAKRIVEAEGDVVRRVVLLQPILDRIADEVASGKRYTISWKDEGTEGPVVVTDVEAMEEEYPADEDGLRVMGVPFGTESKCDTVLPWMRRAEAKRLAKYLGLPLDES